MVFSPNLPNLFFSGKVPRIPVDKTRAKIKKKKKHARSCWFIYFVITRTCSNFYQCDYPRDVVSQAKVNASIWLVAETFGPDSCVAKMCKTPESSLVCRLWFPAINNCWVGEKNVILKFCVWIPLMANFYFTKNCLGLWNKGMHFQWRRIWPRKGIQKSGVPCNNHTLCNIWIQYWLFV